METFERIIQTTQLETQKKSDIRTTGGFKKPFVYLQTL
jgi:hypothetical protein